MKSVRVACDGRDVGHAHDQPACTSQDKKGREREFTFRSFGLFQTGRFSRACFEVLNLADKPAMRPCGPDCASTSLHGRFVGRIQDLKTGPQTTAQNKVIEDHCLCLHKASLRLHCCDNSRPSAVGLNRELAAFFLLVVSPVGRQRETCNRRMGSVVPLYISIYIEF